MHRYVSYALIAVALLTVVVWVVSQFIQPILPANANAGLILFIAALLGVVGFLGKFKDVIDLFRSVGESPHKSPNVITGPVQVVLGNVTVNVTYIVQSGTVGNLTFQAHAQAGGKFVPRQAPPVPPGFTGRVAEIFALKQILLQKSQTVGIVSLHGMGGVGKTTLAAALAHDPEIEQIFSDGTLWANVSGVKDIRRILLQWISVLSPSEPGSDRINLDQLLDRFSILTRNRRLLVVLDDVGSELAPQLQLLSKSIGPMCKLLITSRVVDLAGVQTLVSLDVLPENESLLLLEKGIGRKLSVQERVLAREIVFLLGYHPLALSLAGAFIRETNVGFDEYLEKIRVGGEAANTLDEVRGSNILWKTLDLAYQHLPRKVQHKLRDLSVFATESFDKESASNIWGIGISETEHLLSQFVAAGFLNFENGFFSMHPVVCEYLKGQST